MRRLKKKLFLGLCGSTVLVLASIRACHPEVMDRMGDESVLASAEEAQEEEVTETPAPENVMTDEEAYHPVSEQEGVSRIWPRDSSEYHPLRSVASYATCFPDVQDVQIRAARKWGVRPVANRLAAEDRKTELVYIGSSPYYTIDPSMRRSIPYLVPRANEFLTHLGRAYLDSLYVKGIPLHKFIVSSVLRTEEDVQKLQTHNGNAEVNSCHRFGTTIDICYNRYFTVSPPEGPQRRTVRDDTLKWVLSEVLRDAREEGRCYVKYEVKQGCFHITVR
ncbi:MAG: hypothetical protein J5661_03320 [Bacteroidaceae bacterium]|nr:hypothetical protein [Bacteroidaceae bacterium]